MTSSDGNHSFNDRVAQLDALRFLAAASVMLYHYTYYSPDGSDRTLTLLQEASHHGYLGVDAFFVISGFVVLWSALGRSAGRFVRARVLRLYPEFWICVPLSALTFWAFSGEFGDRLRLVDVPVNMTMLSSFLGQPLVDDVYWTLAVEMKFYFLLWVLLLLDQLKNAERWLTGWMLLSLIATFVDLPQVVRSVSLFSYGPLFASGGLFFLVFDSGWTPTRAIALVTGLALSAYHAVDRMAGFVEVAHITPRAEAITVVVIVLVFAFFATLGRYEVRPSFAARAAVAGALTYPLYLLHNTGRAAFLQTDIAAPRPLLVLTAIVYSLIVSYAVMLVGTGVVRGALQRAWDRHVPAVTQVASRLVGAARGRRT